MQKPLIFMMGKSPAFLPVDRLYAKNHMWALPIEGGYRFGLSAYGVKLLGDIARLSWSVAPGDPLEPGHPMATIEGSKAVSDLYPPIPGVLLELGKTASADPSLLNSDLYDSAWLLSIEGSGDGLLKPEQYVDLLERSWPLVQRLLKGQTGSL